MLGGRGDLIVGGREMHGFARSALLPSVRNEGMQPSSGF